MTWTPPWRRGLAQGECVACEERDVLGRPLGRPLRVVARTLDEHGLCRNCRPKPRALRPPDRDRPALFDASIAVTPTGGGSL